MYKAGYVEKLRAYIKDHDYLNRLLEFTEESSDLELELYLDMSMAELNAMPPTFIRYNYDSHPIPPLVVLNAVPHCLLSNNIRYERNELTYNNGGITVKIPDGDKYLQQLSAVFKMVDSFKMQFQQIKTGDNLSRGFGGSSSPYYDLHNGY